MATCTPTAANLPPWARERADGQGVVLALHVQPGARTSGPAGRHGGALKLRIAAPAADNRANEALAQFLQRALQVPRDGIRIAIGRSARRKLVEVDAPVQQVADRLNAWDRGEAS